MRKEAMIVWGLGVYGKSLYLSHIFFCESITALKIKSWKNQVYLFRFDHL